jgi:hypothetical protein
MAENSLIIDVDVKPLKTQLKEATVSLQAARQKFGEFSQEAIDAAKKVASVKDEIEAAGEQAALFDPGKRFQALTQAASTAAAGVAAVQGAMALFGAESDNVQKALLKVQGAMALSQGLSQLKDIGKVGEQLKISFKGLTAGVNGFKKALIATGIGALVVAVGMLVAYWDDIKGLVGGVSSEQQKLNEKSAENLKVQEEKLDAIDGQSNQLKLQGKSEKDILNLKVKATEEAIKAAKVSLQNAKITKDAQVQAAERNKGILKGIIDFVTAPIKLLLSAIDSIGSAFGKDFGLVAAQEKTNDMLASMMFDPKETAAEADKVIKESEAGLNKLEEKLAGSKLAIQAINKTAADKGKADKEKEDAKDLEAQKILQEAKNKLLDKKKQEEVAIEEAYKEKFKKLEEAGIKDDGSLEAAKQKELTDVRDKYAKEEADKVLAFDKELNKARTEARLSAIKDENERAKQELLANYQTQYADIDANEKYTAEQKLALKKALQEKENLELDTLENQRKTQKFNQDVADLDYEMKQSEFKFNIQKELAAKKLALATTEFENGRMSQTEYTNFLRANADEQKKIDEASVQAKMQVAQQVAGILSSMSDLAGKDTAAGKGLAIAAATINTYTGATQALNSKVPAPEPLATIIRIAQAGVIIATGIKSIREISKTKVPSGGGASAPSISASAPTTASAVPTLGSSPVTAIASVMQNQKPIRAFVVESEVTGTQRRVADIERRAGF